MRAAFHTLGCKVNQVDTQTMMACFLEAGHEIVPFEEQADCYVINTCTVTAMSDKKSRQMIARAHQRNPQALVCVAGCFAQKDAEKALELPGVALVIGNAERGRIVEWVETAQKQKQPLNAVKSLKTEEFEDIPAYSAGRSRAMLKIQEGCNRFCSYCIIPYTRGPLRSRSLAGIRKETERLVAQGYQEFVLTGIHISSWEGEHGEDLSAVVQAVASVENVERIRLGSLEPKSVTEELIRFAAAEPKLCPQFHLSLQSGSDSVLRRMKRHYTAAEFLDRAKALQEAIPNCALTTDVIVGFPGETHEEFEESIAFVEKVGFARIHVFPFSAREGTPAATMSNPCSKAVKKERTARMIALGEKLSRQYRETMIGKREMILIEESSAHGSSGLTSNYQSVAIPSEAPLHQIVPVRVLSLTEDGLCGELCES